MPEPIFCGIVMRQTWPIFHILSSLEKRFSLSTIRLLFQNKKNITCNEFFIDVKTVWADHGSHLFTVRSTRRVMEVAV